MAALPGLALAVSPTMALASITVGPWSPLYQGVDHAVGQMLPDQTDPRRQVVQAMRFDLTAPDLQIFGLPPCTNCGSEVLSTTPSQFLRDYRLQVVVNCNFFDPNSMVPGTPTDVLGLAISQGQVVSPANDAEHPVALLLTTNNHPILIPTNLPPTNTSGIYTAVSGNQLLAWHGVNVADSSTELHPRTALGISQDGRYLYAIVIDGRQPGYSDGATHFETAEWLMRFGAHHGMNVDGGSCSTVAIEDCSGAPVSLNQNSYAVTHDGQERGVGHFIGFHAKPLPNFIRNVDVIPSETTTTILWDTAEPTTAKIEFGTTTNYTSHTDRCLLPLTNHAMTLEGLAPGTEYRYRIVSESGTNRHTWACRFSTPSGIVTNLLFDLTQPWHFTTNNLDAVNWTVPDYDDSGWLGAGPGLLFVETNTSVAPCRTPMPPPHGNPIAPTYYFRTKFLYEGTTNGVGLIFSNYVDDGAVFHLNGSEVYRLRMRPAPATISYADLASGFACSNAPYGCPGEACSVCPDVFTVPPSIAANLRQGTNVLAVEVHNYSPGSLDIVFGTALFSVEPKVSPIKLHTLRAGDAILLYWNGSGFKLQEAAEVGASSDWQDVAEPLAKSPCILTNLTATRFFRLQR